MNDEVKLILTKLKIVSEEKEQGMYLCDKKHSKALLDYITNLQKSQETLIKNDNEIITNLQEENKKLKELCDKYEEEHSNEFQCWKKDRKELLDRKAKMEKAVEIAKRLQRDYGYMLEDLIFLLSTGGDEE